MANSNDTARNRQVNGGIRTLVKDQAGTTAIEYGLISSLIAAALVVGLATAGPTLTDVFTTISTSLQNVLALAS